MIRLLELLLYCHWYQPKRRRGKGEDSPQKHRAAKVTCGAVHHIGRHAVGGRLGVHQPRAVAHGLAVGRAGSHESALIHAGKAALPIRRESTHIRIRTTHGSSSLPQQSFLIMAVIYARGCSLKVIYFLDQEAELYC